MIWGAVRGFFYVWFSLAAGFGAGAAIGLALQSGSGPKYVLPGEGWPLVIFPMLVILAALVSTQWGQFGRRISLWRWIPLCAVVTFGAFVIAGLSL